MRSEEQAGQGPPPEPRGAPLARHVSAIACGWGASGSSASLRGRDGGRGSSCRTPLGPHL